MPERYPPLRAWRRKRRDGSVVEVLALDAQPDVHNPATRIHRPSTIADAAACYQQAFSRVLARLQPGQLSLF